MSSIMKYCAFLRGVNIGGKSMKMAEVCEVFQKAVMQDVSSVLATGNIIFSSDCEVSELKVKLENELSEHFNDQAFLFILNEDEIKAKLLGNPFQKNEDSHTYVFVTAPGTENRLLKEFKDGNKDEGERAAVSEGTFYWQIAKGRTLDSDFGKILGKKAYKEMLTSRNLNTFEKIVTKLG